MTDPELDVLDQGITIPRTTPLQRRNRNNRLRGKSTSAELAKYLGGQNVEGMLWKWDVQGQGYRIQSKRDNVGRSAAMLLRLIEAIAEEGGALLRGVYQVAPRQRLVSGTVTVGYQDWVNWHGWVIPAGATLLDRGLYPLISMPLPLFRDIHVGGPDAAR